jgi:hypothetical protein
VPAEQLRIETKKRIKGFPITPRFYPENSGRPAFCAVFAFNSFYRRYQRKLVRAFAFHLLGLNRKYGRAVHRNPRLGIVTPGNFSRY